jgi:hypothetical protein
MSPRRPVRPVPCGTQARPVAPPAANGNATAGSDAAYDIDFPARDHILVEQLRSRGAINFAKAVCTEYSGRAGNPDGRHAPEKGVALAGVAPKSK